MTEPVLSYHIQPGTHPRRLSGLSGILQHDMSQQRFRRRSTPIHVQALRRHLQRSAQQKLQSQKRLRRHQQRSQTPEFRQRKRLLHYQQRSPEQSPMSIQSQQEFQGQKALRRHLQLSAQQKIQSQKRQRRDQQRRLSRRGDRPVAFSGGRGFFRFRTGGLHHNSNTPRPHRHTDRRCALTAHPSMRPSGRTPRPWGNRNSRKYRTENQ